MALVFWPWFIQPSWENMRNDWGMSNHLVRDFPQKYLQKSSSTPNIPNMLFQPICSNGDWMESWTRKVKSLNSLGLWVYAMPILYCYHDTSMTLSMSSINSIYLCLTKLLTDLFCLISTRIYLTDHVVITKWLLGDLRKLHSQRWPRRWSSRSTSHPWYAQVKLDHFPKQ